MEYEDWLRLLNTLANYATVGLLLWLIITQNQERRARASIHSSSGPTGLADASERVDELLREHHDRASHVGVHDVPSDPYPALRREYTERLKKDSRAHPLADSARYVSGTGLTYSDAEAEVITSWKSDEPVRIIPVPGDTATTYYRSDDGQRWADLDSQGGFAQGIVADDNGDSDVDGRPLE